MGYLSIKSNDLHWLAGILEGEGCFCYSCSPGIRMGGTDKDVVDRIGQLLGRHTRGPYKYKANRKSVFYTEIWGSNAVVWMKLLYKLMGTRRKQKITEILSRWNKAPTKAWKAGTGETPNCHPKRRHYAFRLCRSCYRKDKYKKGLPR